jgi:hypothetical protein
MLSASEEHAHAYVWMWAVINRNNDIVPLSLAHTKSDAITELTGHDTDDRNARRRIWRRWKNGGARVERVAIVTHGRFFAMESALSRSLHQFEGREYAGDARVVERLLKDLRTLCK